MTLNFNNQFFPERNPRQTLAMALSVSKIFTQKQDSQRLQYREIFHNENSAQFTTVNLLCVLCVSVVNL